MYTRPMFIKLWRAFLKTKKKMISSVMSQRTILRAQSLLAERLFSATEFQMENLTLFKMAYFAQKLTGIV